MSKNQQDNRLKLLSYNVQVGIASRRPHHYVTSSWKHLLPHEHHFNNLDDIAALVQHYDIVGLQEVDAGSLRSSFVNQTQYLAEKAGFPYWHHQMNRKIGNIARHSNGLLSQYAPLDVTGHRLPGRLPGRGAMFARYGNPQNPLLVVMMHLALGRQARLKQLAYVGDMIGKYDHVVVMGDLNCQPASPEMEFFLARTGLRAPADGLHTFPSWNPSRKLDHILVSSSLEIESVEVINVDLSDHLPIAMHIQVPESLRLVA